MNKAREPLSLSGVFRGFFMRLGLWKRPRESLRVRLNLHTFSLVGIVLSMGYAGAVQNNGAAYVLCFLTAVLSVMSWLRARENLRGVVITTGRLPGGKAGEVVRLPVEVRAATGQGAWGLEVMSSSGGGKWTFIEEIRAGDSAVVSVPVRVEEAGVQDAVRVVLRSSYPLGLFNAERVVEMAALRHIHPKAEGGLPLPKAAAPVAGESPSFTPAGGSPGREGDDFAGLREWQRGDSLKHVDWRAVARGRPMMVKQWSGGVGEAVLLDWSTLDLPEKARGGQLAQWIEMAEASATPYALRLPAVEIEAGLGPAHAKRCLDALAEVGTQTREVRSSRRHLPLGHERGAHLPPWPLLVLCGILMLAALLLLDVVPVASAALFALCVVVRLGFLEKGWRRRSAQGLASRSNRAFSFLGVGILILGAVAVQWSTGSLVSMEGGIAMLLVLLGGKLLESRTPHDFQVLSLVGWFLCLCCLLSDQTLNRALWTFGIFVGIGVCMVRFRRGSEGWRAPMRLMGVMTTQALPVALLLFVVFPRGSMSFLERLGTERTHVTGISSSMEPGRISKIAASDEVAFRVEFPDSEAPAQQQRYWRCLVLWQCDDGLTWQRGLSQESAPRVRLRRAGDMRQIVSLEPHGQKWLPGLDLPLTATDEGQQTLPDADDVLTSTQSVDSLRRYEVFSRLTQESGIMTEEQKAAALRLPKGISKRLRDLAAELRGSGLGNAQIAQRAVLHLQKQGFQYTLEPGEYLGPGALDEFLFERRVGFCEHFSGSFATLMRAAGVPARIVIGYMGGEWSERGGYMIVRQSDAHAWTELWLEGQGWTRVDPTAALVPARMTLDLRTLLAGGEDELERQRGSFFWRSFTTARLWWDSIEYDWYQTVISFDEEAQIAWMNWLGLGQLRGRWLFLISGGVLLLGLVVLLYWLRRPAPVRDPSLRLWLQCCARLEKLGAPARLAAEGPLNYAARVAQARPELEAEVRLLARDYAQARYGTPEGGKEPGFELGRRFAAGGRLSAEA